MSDKIWFVCHMPSGAEKRVGKAFVGAAGRWLYTNCLKPLGLTRDDVHLGALVDIALPDDALVVAVGKGAQRALGDRAIAVITHPDAALKYGDGGKTAEQIAKIREILKAEEDATAKWEGNWHKYVDPKGGKYVYQKHTRGKSVHYDLRLSSKNNGMSYGWTIVGGEPIGTGTQKFLPKKEHPSVWMGRDGTLPNGDTMEILSSGAYRVGVCHDKLCELVLDNLTDGVESSRIVVSATGVNDAGGAQWVGKVPKDQIPIADRDTLDDVESRLKPGQKLIYGNELITVAVKAAELVAISKSNEAKRIVYGIVLDPYIVDAHGDWTPPLDVQDAAHAYLSGSKKIGYMHEIESRDSTVVESWVELYPSDVDYQKAMRNEPHRVTERAFGNDVVHSGSWVLGIKLGPKLWKRYQTGELNAFSPAGRVTIERVDQDTMPQVEIIRAT